MIIIKALNIMIAFSKDEFAICSENGKYPNGDETEVLVIHTPSRKYSLLGINSGRLDGYEVIDRILEYINENFSNDIIKINLDELTDTKTVNDAMCLILETSD